MRVVYPHTALLNRYQSGVAVMTRNRPHYVRRCFDSLRKSDLSNTLIVILDDASEDSETVHLVENFSMPNAALIKIFLSRHIYFNIHNNLKLVWDMLSERYGCQYLCVLDSDMLVKKYWLKALHALYEAGRQKYGQCIVSGFHSCWQHYGQRRSGYYVKASLGGANMLFDAVLYRQVVRDCLCQWWDDCLMKSCAAPCPVWLRPHPLAGFADAVASEVARHRVRLLTTHPSVCQHIGKTGQHSKGNVWFNFSLNYSWGSTVKHFPIYLYQLSMHATRSLMRSMLNSYARSFNDAEKIPGAAQSVYDAIYMRDKNV